MLVPRCAAKVWPKARGVKLGPTVGKHLTLNPRLRCRLYETFLTEDYIWIGDPSHRGDKADRRAVSDHSLLATSLECILGDSGNTGIAAGVDQ